MLRFKVHQFCLRRTHYLLLPKLNRDQLQVISRRLGKLGSLAKPAGALSAKLKEGMIHVDPAGLCWSRSDPADAILPVMPEVLSCPKAKVSLNDLSAKYYRALRTRGAASVRLSLRLESGPLWKVLRASGECALAPDEHEVVRLLLRGATGRCRVVTDYPTDGSAMVRLGRRRFFDSVVSPDEAASALRMAGTRAPRNSYIPRDGTLALDGGSTLLSEEGARLFDVLGDWCSFTH